MHAEQTVTKTANTIHRMLIPHARDRVGYKVVLVDGVSGAPIWWDQSLREAVTLVCEKIEPAAEAVPGTEAVGVRYFKQSLWDRKALQYIIVRDGTQPAPIQMAQSRPKVRSAEWVSASRVRRKTARDRRKLESALAILSKERKAACVLRSQRRRGLNALGERSINESCANWQ